MRLQHRILMSPEGDPPTLAGVVSDPPADPPKDPPVTDPPADPPKDPPVTDPPADPPKDPPADEDPDGKKKGDGPEEDPNRGVPEEGYADFKPQEGFSLDEEGTNLLHEAGKEFGLSQDGAQKMADFVSKWETMKRERADATAEQLENTHIEACQADKEFGGEDYDKNIAMMGNVILRSYGDDVEGAAKFVAAIGDSHVHPEFVRGMWRMMALIPADHDVFEGGKAPKTVRVSEVVHDSDASRGKQLYGEM